MLPSLRFFIPRGCKLAHFSSARTFTFTSTIPRSVRRSLQKSLQQRWSSTKQPPQQQQPSNKTTRLEEELKRQARAASKSGSTQYELPERLIIYHAGTARTTFLAMVKITSLFIGAFFCFIVTPSYVKAEKPLLETASVAISGIIPILFVAFTTSPFVTHIHIHLPSYARTSQAILDRFVRALPPTTPLTLTTMSAISKPRYSTVNASDLVPTRKRLGLVNYVRDTAEENKRRKWYMFRAVGSFYVQEKSAIALARKRYEPKKKDKVDAWIWDAVKDRLDKRAQAQAQAQTQAQTQALGQQKN